MASISKALESSDEKEEANDRSSRATFEIRGRNMKYNRLKNSENDQFDASEISNDGSVSDNTVYIKN